MRLAPAAALVVLASLVIASRVQGDEPRKDRPMRAVTAETDPCQWVTASLPVDPEAETTVFRGPFFITFLAAGDPLSIVVPQEGRDPVVIGKIAEVSGSTKFFVPAGAYVVAPKGATARLYSGFRPY